MSVRTAGDGWIEIPHSRPPTDQVYIGLGDHKGADDWFPAFKRRRGRRRVLAIPPPNYRGAVTVWTRINGVERRVGQLRL